MSFYLCVEGGGSDSADLKTACRKAFANLLQKAGLTGQMPRIVACGSRNDAFAAFCNHLKQGHSAVLLVDSEDAIVKPETLRPWDHVARRDKWNCPNGASDKDLHFMVRSMEAWLLADPEALAKYFDQEFRARKLPASKPVGDIDRHSAVKALEAASNGSGKGKYGKGAHSFEILYLIAPTKIRQEPWAERFFAEMAARGAP